MKRVYAAVVLTCAAVLILYGVWIHNRNANVVQGTLKVGFIYENDEITPYTYNFSLARDEVEKEYGDRVEILTASNVPENETEQPLRDLVRKGCGIIFINSYCEQVRQWAAEYPGVQFCQVSFGTEQAQDTPENYHTFKGKIYQGRYITGIAAGMKIREMTEAGLVKGDGPLLGYVASYPTAEIISGYTAFLLGARSVAPEVTMRVVYTGAWSSYSAEKQAVYALAEEGCVVISQHTDTLGTAVACEEIAETRPIYHISYNQNMMDVAPTATLTGTRINWAPYITGAVGAVLQGRKIESEVAGNANGNDLSAGMAEGWVDVLDLNTRNAAPGTQEAMDEAAEQFLRGKTGTVFQGNYTGVNPDNPEDTIDLRKGYPENEHYSSPTFHYILEGAVLTE